MLYRFPNDSLLHGVFQHNTSLDKFTGFEASGFVFAPFDAKKIKVLISGEYRVEEIGGVKTQSAQNVMLSDKGKELHLKQVEAAINEIKKTGLRKVVLSRRIEANTKKAPSEIFQSLHEKYENAFCYWWHHPQVGMWLGATPEKLLQYGNGEILTTSLAGTLPVNGKDGPKWTKKEIEEQEMVTGFIANALKGKISNLDISPTRNQRAGKLWHLKSDIKGVLSSSKQLGDIIEHLHPTPAVCGLPKERAFNYIQNNEGYDRDFYTGYLGALNLNSEDSAKLFVNLRCLRYRSGKVEVYVGGGITKSSNPEEEWKETQIKSRTILEVLG